MGIDVVTLALAKKYTKESLAGVGALKGEKGDPFTFEDFTVLKQYGEIILLVAANLVFVIYDIAVSRMAAFYSETIRSKIAKLFKR